MNYAEKLLNINNIKGFDSAKTFVKEMDEKFITCLKERNVVKDVNLKNSDPVRDAKEAIKDYEGSYRESAAEITEI